MPVIRPAVAAALAVPFVAAVASADIISFRQNSAPTGDYAHAATYIRSDNSTNVGSDTVLLTGNTAAGVDLRSLFSFDLSAIPAGATVDSVTLSLFQNTDASSDATAVQLNLQPLTATFTEGGASWTNRAAATPWATPGGDFDATVLSSLTISPTATSTIRTFASTTNFVAAAQAAYDSATPLAFILKLNDETGSARRIFNFSSDDFGSPVAQRPLLTVNYTIPEPTSATLALISLAAIAPRRRHACR